ncbi:MAG: hypothetical protein ACR2HY_07950 [Acidimicrobiales bacterium]
MSDWPLPPYFAPHGPLGDDNAVVAAFLRSVPAPHSDRLHVEGSVLRADADLAIALRLGSHSVLVRRDLPDDVEAVRLSVESALAAEGLGLLDEDTALAIAVATMRVSVRMSVWDLWGTDIDQAFADLRREAVGGSDDVLLGGGLPPVDPEL